MFSGKDAANPAYPTQWALNPTAYQNVDSNSVDWAALAQQWIAMKEAAAIINVPSPPGKPDNEEAGEAPMEVENPDTIAEPIPPAGAEWNAATNSWGSTWNQWGWGWDATGVDPKSGNMGMAPVVDGYTVPTNNTTAAMPGYTTAPAPTFQHGYWTAPQPESSTHSNSSHERSSKSKREYKPRSRRGGLNNRDKPPLLPHVIDPVVMPAPAMPASVIDAAKRRQLPAWIREGLEKMEREKQRAIEREEEKRAREEAEKEKKRLEEEELERMRLVAGGQPMLPAKSKFESDSEGEEPSKEDEKPVRRESSLELSPVREREVAPPSPPKKSAEEIMQEVMLTVRRSLTEILLEVTDQEIHTVSQEELARFNFVQASRLNAMKASKSRALASITTGLGLGAYESSSEESGDEDNDDLSDHQLQEIIRRKKNEFERTSREIEAEVARAEREEQRAIEDGGTPRSSPLQARDGSSTPPPIARETPEKHIDNRQKERRNSNKSHDRVDGHRKLDTIPEEKSKKSNKRDSTPTPPRHKSHKDTSSPSTSDSEADSSTSSSESSDANHSEVKSETKRAKKRKRRSSSESHKKSKKSKSKSDEKKKRDDYDRVKPKSKKDRDRRKSSRSRDYERSHKDKYRDDSVERSRKRKRSRSGSYESQKSRRRDHRDRSYDKGRDLRDRSHEKGRDHRDRSYDKGRDHRDRSYEKGRDHRERSYEKGRDRDRSHDRRERDHDRRERDHDRYERSRDDRRRSRSSSRSRHRR